MPQEPSSPLTKQRILIIGIGNILKGDDGLGVRVAEILSQRELPAGVVVEEVGTPGLDLINRFEGWQKVILVDAVKMGAQPGTWKRFSPQDVRLIAIGNVLSLHEPDLASVLELAQAMNMLPDEIVIYGVEPQNLTFMAPLSSPVEAIMNTIAEQILSEIWKGRA